MAPTRTSLPRSGTGVGRRASTASTRTLPWTHTTQSTTQTTEPEPSTDVASDDGNDNDSNDDGDESEESDDFVDLTVSPTLIAQRRQSARAANHHKASSWIWHVGDEVNEGGVFKWRCNLCIGDHAKRYSFGSTCHIRQHLRKSHQFIPDGPTRLSPITPGQLTIDRYLQNTRIDIAAFKAAMVDFFLVCRIAFSVSESAQFHALLNSVSTSITAIPIPRCADTVRNWSLSRFESAKFEFKTTLASSRSLIHLSLDCWTSSNNLAMIGVVAHWADEKGRFQNALLALRELSGLYLLMKSR
jgi:hypothetical protein